MYISFGERFTCATIESASVANAQVTIRALATSQDGARQSSVVTRTFTVLEAEEGSDVDTVSVASAGERNVSDILLDQPLQS